jgi:hypothetical protein
MEQTGASSPMPQYQCHKKVRALKILGVESIKPTVAELQAILDEEGGAEPPGGRLTVEAPFAPLEVSPEWMRKHNPQIGGYFVQYEDGYVSFSPAKAFEEGYTKIR